MAYTANIALEAEAEVFASMSDDERREYEQWLESQYEPLVEEEYEYISA